jgi:hypothetical protein
LLPSVFRAWSTDYSTSFPRLHQRPVSQVINAPECFITPCTRTGKLSAARVQESLSRLAPAPALLASEGISERHHVTLDSTACGLNSRRYHISFRRDYLRTIPQGPGCFQSWESLMRPLLGR